MQQRIRFVHHGDRALLLVNGRIVCDGLPWQALDKIATAARTMARLCEETEKAAQVIADNALLLRAGVPVGLSDDRRIKAESVRAAIHDRALRRYLPGGVRSREAVGAPTIIRHVRGNQT